MNIEDGLFYYLTNNVGVAAIVSTRVYPLVMAQKTTLPAITYQTTALTPDRTLDGNTGRITATIQINAWAETHVEVKSLAEALRLALNDYSGAMGSDTVQRSRVESEKDGWDDETQFYRVSMQITVIYYEAAESAEAESAITDEAGTVISDEAGEEILDET